MRSFKITITDENGILFDNEWIEVSDSVRYFNIVPATTTDHVHGTIATLDVGEKEV